MSPKIVTVWNPSPQLCLGNSDLSFQEVFFNWNRNSCISYLPDSLHCCKNQQIPVQNPRQPVSEDTMKIFEDKSARTESVQVTGAEISRSFHLIWEGRQNGFWFSDKIPLSSIMPTHQLLDTSPEAPASLGIHGSPAVFYAEQLPSCPVCFHSYIG